MVVGLSLHSYVTTIDNCAVTEVLDLVPALKMSYTRE